MNLEHLQLLASAIVPFIMFAIGALFKRISKIEERQYDMKGELVTKDELQKAEERITNSIGAKMDVLIQLFKTDIKTK